jgi:plasmid replication initiation protein
MSDKPDAALDEVVVKSNRLVQARINWTKIEHRVVAMLISQLKKGDEAFDVQRVYVRDIIEQAGSNSEDLFNRAEEICQKLLNQKVHIRMQTPKGKRVYRGYNCMSMCEFVEGSGFIRAKFNEDMRPFLLQLKERFTMYRLQNFMRLSSQYSMRIYELLKMREGLRFLRVSVEELREMLACEHTYSRFSDFKRRVLEAAREELKEKCDIYFTYTVEREGRTPVRVNFAIKHRDDDEGKRPPQPDQIDDRTQAEEPAADRQAGSPRINVYAMVVDEMTQEEIDTLKESEIREAVEAAEATVRERSPDDGTASRALQAYRLARQTLRGNDA